MQSNCPPGGCGYRCKCGAGTAKTRLVTASGAVATYTATTLAQYTELRKSMTITTTVTQGEPAVETKVALAVAAGGVAWYLVGEFCLTRAPDPVPVLCRRLETNTSFLSSIWRSWCSLEASTRGS